MYQTQLLKIGLTKTQANTMDYLFESGESRARDIARAIKQPRGAVYNSLDELLAMDLVEKIEKDKQIAKFRAVHPRKLELLLEKREKGLNQDKKMFEEVLPSLISNYNLGLNKPGVKFYEGIDGMKKILDDTLTSKTDIYLFLNLEALNQEKKFIAINEEYKRRRERAGIRKKILRAGIKPANSSASTGDEYEKITQIKYIEKSMPAFKSSIQIYDNKISYQLIDGENIISILIEDKNIYEMNKAMFEMLWEMGK
jgi:HTH-type transcriptional regulator, sugar sensing transcriptional regulator